LPATTAAPENVTRCQRCATKLRNSRKRCPCCDLDLSAPLPVLVDSDKEPAPGEKRIRPARPTNKLCPVCMSSFPEAEMLESGGKMVCKECSEVMSKSGAKGGSMPMAAASSSNAAASSTAPIPKADVPDATSLRWQEEALGKKLSTSKWMMGVCGFLNIVVGILLVVASTAGSALGDKFDSMLDDEGVQQNMRKSVADNIERETGHKASSSEIDLKMNEIKIHRDEGRAKLEHAAFLVKLLGMAYVGLGFIMFGLLFFMNKFPFECSLAALILYCILKGIQVVMGDIGLVGIAISLSIIGSMFTGVQAGHAIKQLRAKYKNA